jgi:hypothetical protein
VAVLSMSKQEFNRLEVLLRVQSGGLRISDACVLMGLQRRQLFRLLRGLKQEGATSLVSKRRGKPSNHRLPAEVRTLALSIVRERYADFGPTLAAEKLAEHHGCSVSRETLRGWMIADGLWQDRRHRLPSPHQPRRRRDCLGELVQIDGSEHAWFEDRGPPCTLLAFVDDATSQLMQLRFVTSESAFDYFRSTRAYLEEHGKPVAFYSDKHSIFRVNSKDAAGGDGVTQFGRALLALNIDIICANSPQAKGRIERAFGTLQDRMVKSLPSRRRGSCGWRTSRRLLRRMRGCRGSSPPITGALAGIRPMPRTCIGRCRRRMIWTRSWPGGRSARSRAT